MRLLLTSLLLAAAASAQASAQVSSVKSVYVMPMTGGLDQYLALQLSNSGNIQVVTDPQKADAILTDRIGGHFEERWDEMMATKTEKDKSDAGATFARVGVSGTAAKGTFFLIERSTRNVLWSTFALPKATTPHELNRTAEIIAERLGKTAKGK